MAFNVIGELPTIRLWEGVIGRIIEGEHLTLAIVELAANQLIPEHQHHNEQVGFLVRGTARFRVGAEEKLLREAATWRILANIPHEVQAGQEGAVVVEAFSPIRADWHSIGEEAQSVPLWP